VLFFSLSIFKVAQRAAFQHRLGAFWLAYWPVSLSGICVSIWIGGRIGSSPNAMSLIAMIGLLPLINLPFDWASIGLTRALLRRGCEDRGPRLLRSPTLLGLIDFLLGLILLVTLALTLILAFSTADAILLHAGRRMIFDAVGLIERIAARPDDPAHGWIYFTLLSTLLPSFFNLLVGVFSLLALSVPRVRYWLIETIPTLGGAGLSGTRWQVVFALSFHWFCGVFLSGLGLWLVWQICRLVPNAEHLALMPMHTFAIWCARLLPASSFVPP
jgi:hypothetical protein